MEKELLSKAKELWDKGLFYESHEVLEDVWRLFPKEDKHSRNCYQGLIRLAIAYNHYKEGRKDSALRVLKMVRQQLSCCGEVFRSINIRYILSYVEEHIRRLESGQAITEYPTLKLIE